MDPGATSTDLYVLSGNGKALITWDHHTAENGLLVELVSVDDASQLLRSLNNLGAELELYSREHA